MTFVLASIATLFYLFFKSSSIYGGDAGDLVSAAVTHGVAHPPGFPLYTSLGYLITHLPISTPAWRVGLLSSIPAAMTLVVIYLIITKLTKDRLSALLSVAILGLTYIFWLYSIVVEVFMFHLLLMSTLIYLLILWHETKKASYLYTFFFIFGLSLTHHHLILTCLPAFGYLLWINREEVRNIVKNSLFFVLGLLPYLYVYFAAKTNPSINWGNPVSLHNFIRLITRAEYGSFQSGPLVGQTLSSRFLQIPTYFFFLKDDITAIGLILAIFGVYFAWRRRKDKPWFNFLILLFISTGPLYFFYASYIITDGFALAIFERFLLPSYLILSIFIGIGTSAIKNTLETRIGKLNNLVYLMLLILPISLFIINYPKISILKSDTTAENHGKNILDTLPHGAILILERDNSLFDTQYVYYGLKYRPDVKFIHSQKLVTRQLGGIIKKYYPNLIVPTSTGTKYVDDFLAENYEVAPIYSEGIIPTKLTDIYWLPYGLLYRMYRRSDLPKPETVKTDNERLWTSYVDPFSGSLGHYQNLMLASILKFYSHSRLETGIFYMQSKDYKGAKAHFEKGLTYDPANPRAYLYLGITEGRLGQCKQAEETLTKGIKFNNNSDEFYAAFSDLYEGCFHDESKAAVWDKRLLKLKKDQETPLKGL